MQSMIEGRRRFLSLSLSQPMLLILILTHPFLTLFSPCFPSSSQSEVHRLVTKRDPKFTNFIEFRKYKIVYRRYAGLYFSYCVDLNDNELAWLESIHLLVELLDKYFSDRNNIKGVCELDLVFHFWQIYSILDEIYLGGEVQETAKKVILDRLNMLSNLD